MFYVDDLKVRFMYNKDRQDRVVTTCMIERSPAQVLIGTATCANGDTLRKATGRKIALARALQSFDRTTRSDVWAEYFKHVKDKG